MRLGNRFIVMTARACMPASVKAPYRRVAVVERTADYCRRWDTPAMISERARGVSRIVKTWERTHAGYGNGPRTAYARALREAEALADRLNAGADQPGRP